MREQIDMGQTGATPQSRINSVEILKDSVPILVQNLDSGSFNLMNQNSNVSYFSEDE
jgi:hypothetical protein